MLLPKAAITLKYHGEIAKKYGFNYFPLTLVYFTPN